MIGRSNAGGGKPEGQYGILVNDVDSNGYPTDITVRYGFPIAESYDYSPFNYGTTGGNRNKLLLQNCENILLDIPGTYGVYSFQSMFSYFPGKLKIKGCTGMGNQVFGNICSAQSTGKRAVFIPNTVQTMGVYVFYYATDLTVYCEANSKPDGWAALWNTNGQETKDNKILTTMWGVTEAQFDAL